MTKIHFCGVSGNGMSALAQIMKLEGNDVSGSDAHFDIGMDTDRRQALESAGIIIYPQDGTGIADDTDTLYTTNTVNASNPDIKAGVDKNIQIRKRSDLLADIFHRYPHNIAVGGTSGKTTTTAMIGYVLDKLGQKPCMINGGFLNNYADRPGLANYICNQGDICVIEADESDGSIVKYHPYIGIVNNVTFDHKPVEVLMEYFREFASHVSHALIVGLDCANASQIKHHKKTLTFSIKDSKADIFAYNISPIPGGIKYSVNGRSFTLKLIGRYNVYNALAAILACRELGIDIFDAAAALESFTGTQQRMQLMGTTPNGITVYNDFAHNPQKIEAALSALREYPGRLIASYLAHTSYSARTTGEQDGEIFGRILNPDDILLMMEVYERDPIADADISGADLAEMARKHGATAHFTPTQEDVRQFILQNARPGDRIVIMGAHDTSLPDFSRQLVKDLSHA